MRELARRLRTSHADAYAALADRVEEELGLAERQAAAGCARRDRHVPLRGARAPSPRGRAHRRTGKFGEALELVAEREQQLLARPRRQRARPSGRPLGAWRSSATWRPRCERPSGRSRAKRPRGSTPTPRRTAGIGSTRRSAASRRGSRTLDEEPEERPLGVVRRAYEDACHAMADGFTRALAEGWLDRRRRPAPDARLQRSRVGQAEARAPTSWSMRCASRWASSSPSACPRRRRSRFAPAIGALPSITPDRNGGAACRARRRASPSSNRAASSALASTTPSCPISRPGRSSPRRGCRSSSTSRSTSCLSLPAVEARQEARGRAGRRRPLPGDRPRRRGRIHLPGAAGHGHRHRQPGARDPQARRRRASSTRWSPRTTGTCSSRQTATSRCASTRPAATRSSCIGVAGSAAAGRHRRAAFASPPQRSATPPTSSSCFPAGSGVFRAGGDLAFHHGGPSLQELVVPVLTVRTQGARTQVRRAPPAGPIVASGLPDGGDQPHLQRDASLWARSR